MSTTATKLEGIVAEHVAAVSARDSDAIMATFADDAYVNDGRREFRGIDAIRRFIEKEIVGDNITMDVREVVDHYGDTIVRAAYEGDFDKTNLPDGAEVTLSNYFSVRDGRIVSLVTSTPGPRSTEMSTLRPRQPPVFGHARAAGCRRGADSVGLDHRRRSCRDRSAVV